MRPAIIEMFTNWNRIRGYLSDCKQVYWIRPESEIEAHEFIYPITNDQPSCFSAIHFEMNFQLLTKTSARWSAWKHLQMPLIAFPLQQTRWINLLCALHRPSGLHDLILHLVHLIERISGSLKEPEAKWTKWTLRDHHGLLWHFKKITTQRNCGN